METFYFEMTDTYGGEANYCWVQRFKVVAKSLHAALCKVSKETGYNFRSDGGRWNAVKSCVCLFDIGEDEQATYVYKFIEL
jgi:hypothetical protein